PAWIRHTFTAIPGTPEGRGRFLGLSNGPFGALLSRSKRWRVGLTTWLGIPGATSPISLYDSPSSLRRTTTSRNSTGKISIAAAPVHGLRPGWLVFPDS